MERSTLFLQRYDPFITISFFDTSLMIQFGFNLFLKGLLLYLFLLDKMLLKTVF